VDADRFDALIQSLAVPSRRAALHGLLGGGVAALLALLSTDDSAAKKCRKKKRKCQGKCIPKKHCCKDSECADGRVCTKGACACLGSQVICDDACVDLATDPAHCGVCDRVCSTGTCVHGACSCDGEDECPPGCPSCIDRVEGGGGCNAGSLNLSQPCQTDDDCAVGSFCGVINVDPFCTNPCPA
jgi:hypothetical protein